MYKLRIFYKKKIIKWKYINNIIILTYLINLINFSNFIKTLLI